MTEIKVNLEARTAFNIIEEMGYHKIRHIPFTRFDLYGNGDYHRIVYCHQDSEIVAEYDATIIYKNNKDNK